MKGWLLRESVATAFLQCLMARASQWNVQVTTVKWSRVRSCRDSKRSRQGPSRGLEKGPEDGLERVAERKKRSRVGETLKRRTIKTRS